jgi:hypothetical protein
LDDDNEVLENKNSCTMAGGESPDIVMSGRESRLHYVQYLSPLVRFENAIPVLQSLRGMAIIIGSTRTEKKSHPPKTLQYLAQKEQIVAIPHHHQKNTCYYIL